MADTRPKMGSWATPGRICRSRIGCSPSSCSYSCPGIVRKVCGEGATYEVGNVDSRACPHDEQMSLSTKSSYVNEKLCSQIPGGMVVPEADDGRVYRSSKAASANKAVDKLIDSNLLPNVNVSVQKMVHGRRAQARSMSGRLVCDDVL